MLDVTEAPIAALLAMVLNGGAPPRARLGLPTDAPHEACRKRYLALALRLHPDKTSDARAAEAFTALEAAFHSIEAAERVATG